MRFRATLILGLFISPLLADVSFQGQASAWSTFKSFEEMDAGCRYVPQYNAQIPVSGEWSADAEASIHTTSRWFYFDNDWSQTDNLKFYRAWARLSSPHFECRIGLQKINFGPARMLRSLMWFDRIDPRDPLQITDGVYGLLLRYYFENNTNLWFWGLTGNDDPKGMEMMATKKKSLESGVRIQFPAGPGEIGLTTHHRKIDPRDFFPISDLRFPVSSYSIFSEGGGFPVSDFSEYRLALDARYDIEVGLWAETAVIYQDWDLLPIQYRKFITLGMDYTFNIGNGLYIQAEHMQIELTKDWQKVPNEMNQGLSALSVNYPLGLIDNINAIFYVDWENDNFYRFIRWQRSWDRWQLHIMGFWNPKTFNLPQYQMDENIFTGEGVQIMIVFNH